MKKSNVLRTRKLSLHKTIHIIFTEDPPSPVLVILYGAAGWKFNLITRVGGSGGEGGQLTEIRL